MCECLPIGSDTIGKYGLVGSALYPPHQLVIKKIAHRIVHRPIRLREFFSCVSLFPGNSRVTSSSQLKSTMKSIAPSAYLGFLISCYITMISLSISECSCQRGVFIADKQSILFHNLLSSSVVLKREISKTHVVIICLLLYLV